jgi:O-antigen/teichoic acid export membrane protein
MTGAPLEPEAPTYGTSMRPGARMLAVAVAQRTAGHVVSIIVGAVSLATMTRYLSVSSYAHYVTASVLLALVTGLLDGGFTSVCIREAAKDERRRVSLARQAVGFRLAAAFTAVLLLIAFVLVTYGGRERHDVLIGVAVLAAPQPLLALTAGWSVLGESSVRIGRLVLADMAGRLGGLVLLVAAVRADAGLVGILLGVASASFLAFLALVATHRGQGWDATKPIRPQAILLRQALPLGLALLLNVLYFRVDAVLISVLRPAREMALYGFSYRLLEVVLTLGAFVLASLLPILSMAVQDQARWRDLADRAFRFFQALGLVVATCGAIEADRLARLIGGDAYEPAGTALGILILSAALSWVNGFGGLLLISKDLQGRALWLNVTALSVNLVANVCLLPVFGYLAAAWITVFSELVNFIGVLILLDRIGGYAWRPRGLHVSVGLAIGAAGSLIAARSIGAPALADLLLAGCVWLAGALRFGVVPAEVLRRSVRTA